MNQKSTIQKILSGLLAGLLLAGLIATPAQAQEIYRGDTIPKGMTLDQDVILFGKSVTIDGIVNGNVFILGNEVQVNGMVDGSLILIGQNAIIRGTVNGAVYVAALTLDLAENAVLSRDLYVVSVSLTSGKDSRIERDLYAIGLDSGMNGQVGRNLHTTIGPIQLYNGLMTLLGFEELTLKLHFDIPQPAPTEGGGSSYLHLQHSITLAGSGLSPILLSLSPTHTTSLYESQPQAGFDWAEWALDLARDFGVLLVLGLLALWRFLPRLEKAGQLLRSRPLHALAIGLLGLVVAINLFIAILLVAVLIFAIGLGLNFLGLWLFSLLFFIVAFSILALVTAILWLFIVYGTKIIAVYALARWVFDTFTHKQAFWVSALALLAGLVIYSLARSIPYLGWVFGLVFTALGLGSAWLARRERRKEARIAQAPVPRKNKSR